MKPIIRYILAFGVFALLLAALAAMDRGSKEVRHKTTCTGIKVEILDKDKMDFVTAEDVTTTIQKEYGICKGKRIDSVDLKKIENILDGRSAVLKSEAYTSKDGTVHITITQREPVAIFTTSDGKSFYADETGFMFPVRKKFKGNIPEISGDIPIAGAGTFKGEPATAKEKKWLTDMTSLIIYVRDNKIWHDAISKIIVKPGGDLVMTPSKGSETFLFGKPDNYIGKFRRLERYYEYIAPTRDGSTKDKKPYKSVNVKFDGQIVCR